MTITIVTPSYNQGEYIEETIKSVISQEGDFFIEYFIMDGGSTDNSIKIISKYEQLLRNEEWPVKCRGIKYSWISEKDKGQTDAINKGCLKATGDIVSYINSDDLYFPGAFAIVTEHFQRCPEDDFLYGDGDVIDEHGNIQWEWLSRPYNLSLMKSYHFLWNDFTNYILQQATFWRVNVFNKIGLLNESFHYAMDVEYWIRAGAAGLRLIHIPVKLGKFRMITGTKSLSRPTVFWPDMLEIFRKYNGPRKMTPFFSYYFYNIALNNGYDIQSAWLTRADIFSRWNKLCKNERDILEKEVNRGFNRACLLIINKSFFENNKNITIKILKDTLRENFFLIFHPLMLIFAFKHILGQKVSTRLNKIKESLIKLYRQRRYQYRYLENK